MNKKDKKRKWKNPKLGMKNKQTKNKRLKIKKRKQSQRKKNKVKTAMTVKKNPDR